MPPSEFTLEAIPFGDLPGWWADDVDAAWPAFVASAQAIARGAPELRRGKPTTEALTALAVEALAAGAIAPREFFTTRFAPWRIRTTAAAGFVTAYYEPRVAGSLTRTPAFAAPILSAPARPAGSCAPLPPRRNIRAGALDGRAQPLVWLRDAVEVFLIQVQGSARVTLPDGTELRLVYAGRNGHPYTSIGRLLIGQGAIAADEMSLATLKSWLRANGADCGGPADDVMNANASYVFFRAEPADQAGPIGGQGLPLTPERSIAVDRAIWPYGLPFWIDAPLEPAPFRRLTIAQDTGSAIVGAARADLFLGSGDEAGARAGLVRHAADLVVLLPKATAP